MMVAQTQVLGMMHGGTWTTVWLLPGLALAVLAVVAATWLLANLRGTPRSGADPLHELDLRYARGEISSDEYRERRQHLGV